MHYYNFPILGHAKIAGYNILEILSHSIMIIQVIVDGKHCNLALHDVLYISDISKQLFLPNPAI